MSKKQTLSKTELQEMTGLDFSEQNSQVEENRKKSVDAALEDFSIENIKPLPLPSVAEQAQTEAAPSIEEVTDEVPPTNVVEEQPPTPTIQRRVSSKQRKLSLEEYRGMTFKINRRTGKNEGLSFTKDGYTFKASDVSRQFSYSKLNAQLSWDIPKKQTEIEPKQQPIRQEAEQNYSVTDSLIESNGLGLFSPSDAPPEEEQPPSWQKQKKKERKKNRGIRF